jgi:hypothetical protein
LKTSNPFKREIGFQLNGNWTALLGTNGLVLQSIKSMIHIMITMERLFFNGKTMCILAITFSLGLQRVAVMPKQSI